MKASAKILERIEKLLRMSKDVSSPNEAAIAASRAAKLMEKYQIEEAEIIIDELNSGVGMAYEDKILGKSIPVHLNMLAVAVAKFHDCQAKGVQANNVRGFRFVGYKEDVKAAMYTYNFISYICDSLCTKDWNEYKAKGGTENGRGWKVSYKKGFVCAVVTVLKELKRSSQPSEAGTSLMLAKENAISTHFGAPSYSTSATQYSSSDSYGRGYEQGKSVRLNKSIEGKG